MKYPSSYLVAYDICDPRRLRRVAKLMERFGLRIQKSVFECAIPQTCMAQLVNAAKTLIDPAVDGIRIYPLSVRTRRESLLLGFGPVPVIYQSSIVV